jgi:septum formation protein
VLFHTALCVSNESCKRRHERLSLPEVAFRRLTDAESSATSSASMALDCAGSAKSEGWGISLLLAARRRRPHALVGTARSSRSAAILRAEGYDRPRTCPGAWSPGAGMAFRGHAA